MTTTRLEAHHTAQAEAKVGEALEHLRAAHGGMATGEAATARKVEGVKLIGELEALYRRIEAHAHHAAHDAYPRRRKLGQARA